MPRDLESVRLGFAGAKYPPLPYRILEVVAGECFQSFAAISNPGSILESRQGGEREAKAPSREASAPQGPPLSEALWSRGALDGGRVMGFVVHVQVSGCRVSYSYYIVKTQYCKKQLRVESRDEHTRKNRSKVGS